MKKQFRNDIIALKALYVAFRASESFYAGDDNMGAYDAYWAHLQGMCKAYGKTARQIAGAMNI